MTLATLKMDPVNPEKNATIDGTNRKRKEAPPNTATTRLPAEAVEACAEKVCILILIKISERRNYDSFPVFIPSSDVLLIDKY